MRSSYWQDGQGNSPRQKCARTPPVTLPAGPEKFDAACSRPQGNLGGRSLAPPVWVRVGEKVEERPPWFFSSCGTLPRNSAVLLCCAPGLTGDDSENQIWSIVEGTDGAFIGKHSLDVTLHIISHLRCYYGFPLVRSYKWKMNPKPHAGSRWPCAVI
jgi:hypothetical protein